jgi:ADP-ribosylglycohydrolase
MSKLFDKIYGCEACAAIGNSMGEPVEGWTWEKIEKEHGFVETFLPGDRFEKDQVSPQRFGEDWIYRAYHREPGWTEDGMERYKLVVSAIAKKRGRIGIEDLAREWIEGIDPEKFGYHVGPQDLIIYNLLKGGLPPWEVGRYAKWPGFMGTSKMIVPIGIVNAGRPDNAARDALDLARIKDAQGRPIWRNDTFGADGVVRSSLVWDWGNEVAAAIAAATAEALRPSATMDSIVATALAQIPREGRRDPEAMVTAARESRGDWKKMRDRYTEHFQGQPISNAIEVLSGGLACFILADGHPREAILYAVNFGRDTDCKAYTAGCFAGALRGIAAVPRDWVDTVERAVLTDPYTVVKRTMREEAGILHDACLNELRKAQAANREIESLLND